MGYEILYRYKEALENPGTYGEEVKTKSVKVGKVTDEVGLEVVAGKVMSQLARRNILIVDVEIYEYAKKKLGYRETSDGIVIKGKKFSFDSGSVVTTDDFESEPEADFKPVPSPSRELADRSCPAKRSQNIARRTLRQEVYDPDPIGEQKVRQKGLKFTMGRKYPVYSEESLGSTLVYNTTDDSGKDVKVSAEYFVAVGAGLSQEDEGPKYVGAENQKEEINLWGNYERTEMPDIRRR
ncbi:MAG: hypothetical protein EBU90_21355 [Proteobacteria bacterium]|nr:hypothetical protein [Pseudomonadota bacterium]